ncbi:hypothetical protein D3C77_530650 [compost metagenome]
MRITLRQQQQQRLPLAQHARQFVEQGDQLMPEQRHQDQQEHRQGAHEQGKDQADGIAGRHPQTLQGVDQPLHKERQDHTGKHRSKHTAQGQDGSEGQNQQDRQYHRLFIREVALHPVAKHFEH